MSENLLPDIHVKIGKHEQSIHALNRHMRRKMNVNKGDLLRPSLVLKGHAHSQNYLVRLSFSNKTVVYKRRAPPIDRGQGGGQGGESEEAAGQCHKSNRIVILKQSCRYDTEQECQELKACRSQLNTKARPKNQLFEMKKKKYSLNCPKGRHRSLIGIDTCQKMRKTKHDEFQLLPWQDQETKIHKNKRIDDRALQPHRFL